MRINKRLQSESGQSVILISMVILSFLLFFSFAINTGVLITAKISVQSAADAAAYAGAATQARQLNAISFLNYDMRRQYKKFTYRNNFLGNIGAANFPNAGGGGQYTYPKLYYTTSSANTKTTANLGIPITCIPLTGSSSKSENCLQLNLPNSSYEANQFFPNGGLTAITQAFLEASSQISAMQNSQCAKLSSFNLYVQLMWLFRGDIDLAKLRALVDQLGGGLTQADKEKVYTNLENLTYGLGIYPRNILNHMRIKTLESFLNQAPQNEVQNDNVQAWEKSTSAESHERTILAFKSALTNLNNEVMNHNQVIMREIQGANQIKLELISPSFATFFQAMIENQTGGDQTICNSDIKMLPAPFVPAGVKNIAKTPVHYAVKIIAKAKLLFSPISDGIELEAVAAAKPFGSRIGPDIQASEFVTKVNQVTNPVSGSLINDCGQNPNNCYIPNLTITGNDSYLTKEFLQTMMNLGRKGSNQFIIDQFGGGIYQAIAPQAAEVGRYNILPPPKKPEDMRTIGNDKEEFIPYASDENSKIYRVYAPIFDQASGSSSVKDTIKNTFDDIFGQTGLSQGSINWQSVKQQIQADMLEYVTSKMPTGGAATENGETQTFAAIELPMAQWTNFVPNKYWLTKSEEVRSSWAPIVKGTINPRFGYSVKLVALQNLTASGATINEDDKDNINH